MGAAHSLTAEELQEMKMASGFSAEELERLLRIFNRIDLDRNGSLSEEEMLKIPELEHNPLARRVIATIDTDGNGEIDYKEFVLALAVFTLNNRDAKYRFTFNLYDVNKDGFISNGDLYHVLKAMVGSNLKDEQLQQLVDRTILQGDKDRDGRLSYQEFVEMVQGSDLEGKIHFDLNQGS